MQDAVLTLNAGSSTLKFALFASTDLRTLARGRVEGLGSGAALFRCSAREQHLRGDDHAAALDPVLAWIAAHDEGRPLVAAGHRVVHGGVHYAAPVRIDAAAQARLAELIPLAPLHQPHNLAAVTALTRLQPYLLKQLGYSAAEIEDLLYHHSGLLGVSGVSGDMRTLLASDDQHARAAVDLFVYWIGREIGSLAAARGGV